MPVLRVLFPLLLALVFSPGLRAQFVTGGGGSATSGAGGSGAEGDRELYGSDQLPCTTGRLHSVGHGRYSPTGA